MSIHIFGKYGMTPRICLDESKIKREKSKIRGHVSPEIYNFAANPRIAGSAEVRPVNVGFGVRQALGGGSGVMLGRFPSFGEHQHFY